VVALGFTRVSYPYEMTLLQVLSIHTEGSGVIVNKTKAKTIHFAAIFLKLQLELFSV
jgi:hypothetical protein